MNTALNQRITISVDEAMSATGIGKTMLYELLGDGSLRSIKLGKKRLIIVESLHELIASMESYGDLSK
ncbi:excisionase family DNA-binding protein [Tunturibacter empetritectus]|uniref:Excisionase family DNA binding protein n=1 Tax=Tunturiibacter lichenicola TaxID=2051959 RepID=A0A7W8J5Y7_9BACT|nr:excisionase family DNA-binding protein [Edaphobacter lichenicola]MBB5343168.1 excisionase family DNA binding protein [Edaphobacter lichenicola]